MPVAVLAALTAVALGFLYSADGVLGRLDTRLRPPVEGVGYPWRRAALAVDFLGEPVGAALLVIAVVTGCLLLRRPGAAVFTVVGAGLAVAATKLLKPLVGRTINGEHLSYPSGHTAFLTAIALVVALLVAGRPGTGRAAGAVFVLAAGLVAGAAMGWAQVALNAHYVTDVLGGWFTALAAVPAAALLVDLGARAARRERR
ncbi:phosphatase PAP2 family protein [Streptomyces sp. NPDC003691]